jgi:hypothetical protein
MSTASGQHGEQHDPLVFSFLIRRRVRETAEEAHAMLLRRWRSADCEGDNGTDSTMGAEIRSLMDAKRHALEQTEGPPRDKANHIVRDCYLRIAVTALILAERVTRPDEPPRGQRGGRKGEGSFRRADFSVPAT